MYFPMKYKIVITNTGLKLICIGQFVLAVAFTMIQFNVPIQSSGFYCGDNVSGTTTLAGRTISRTLMLVNIIPYLLMLWYLKKRRQKVDVVGNATHHNTTGKITLISSFLFICYAPVIILSDVQSNFPASTGVGIALVVCEFFALVNSVVNPVLYAWRFYEVRYQFLRLICFWDSRRMDVLHQRRQQHFATFEINTRQAAVQKSPDEHCTWRCMNSADILFTYWLTMHSFLKRVHREQFCTKETKCERWRSKFCILEGLFDNWAKRVTRSGVVWESIWPRLPLLKGSNVKIKVT